MERYGLRLEVFKRWLQARYGERVELHVGLLSVSLLSEYYEALVDFEPRNGGRSKDTRRRMVEDEMLAWKWAYESEEYGEWMPRPGKVEMTRDAPRRVYAPSWKEMDACIAASRGWIRQVAVLMRFTGLRVQQAMLLKWDDFDLADATLYVRPELGKTPHERAGRLVPVSPHLGHELATWGRGDDYVVASGRRRGGARERVFRARDLGRAWARAGVRERVWHGRPSHAFRKGFVTGLKRAGAEGEAVEFLVGHKLPGLRDVYLDPDAHELREAVVRIPAPSVVMIGGGLRAATGTEAG
jgi:integrase